MVVQRRDSFDLGASLVARKAFRFAGKDYKPGDAFPWRRMSVAERKVRNMLGSGHLMYVEAEEVAAEEATTEKKAPAKKKAAAKKKAPAKKAE